MSMGLYNGEKTRSSTLRLTWPTYGRRGIGAQKNSDSWCSIFNSDRNQIKSKSLHKRMSPPFETRFYWNCEYHKGRTMGAYIQAYRRTSKKKTTLKSTWLKVLYLYVYLRIRIKSGSHKILSIPFIAFSNLISLMNRSTAWTFEMYYRLP